MEQTVRNASFKGNASLDHSVQKTSVYRVVCIILLIALAILMIFPLYWIITGSFKDARTINSAVPVWFPLNPTVDNYSRLFERPAGLWMFNTVFMCAMSMLLTCVSAAMGGYALAKKRFAGRALLFSIFVCAMALPKQVILIPLLKEMAFLGIHNTLWAVIFPTVGWPFGVFLMKQFSENIPGEMLEAARIDGASTWRIFWKIIFPLMGPINATIAILTALWAWNDFLLPLIILTDQSNQTIPLAQYVFSSQFATNYPQAFASYLMAMAPILIVYIFAQKWVVGGVMRGAVK